MRKMKWKLFKRNIFNLQPNTYIHGVSQLMTEHDHFIDTIHIENMFIFEYLVADNIACGSLNLWGNCMSHYIHCFSTLAFWMLTSISLCKSSSWPTQKKSEDLVWNIHRLKWKWKVMHWFNIDSYFYILYISTCNICRDQIFLLISHPLYLDRC